MGFARLLLVSIYVSATVACVSTSIAPEERAALKRVAIAKVELPDKPMVLGPSAGGSFLLAGPLGLAIAQGTSDLPGAYSQLLKQQRIDIAEYIRLELKSQLAAKGIDVVDAGARVPTMTVRVRQYGLTGGVFSDDRFPQLVAFFEISKPDGTVIWKNMGAAHISQKVQKQVEARPINDYFQDSRFHDAQLRKTHNIVISEALGTL